MTMNGKWKGKWKLCELVGTECELVVVNEVVPHQAMGASQLVSFKSNSL